MSVTPEGFAQAEAIAGITPAAAEAVQAGHSSGGDCTEGMHTKCESCFNQAVSLAELSEVESLFAQEPDIGDKINDCGYWDFQYFSVQHPHCVRCATVAIAYYRAFLAMEKFRPRVARVVDA